MLFLGLYTAEYERTFVPDELRQVMSRFGRYERYDCSSKDPPSPPMPLSVGRLLPSSCRPWGSSVLIVGLICLREAARQRHQAGPHPARPACGWPFLP